MINTCIVKTLKNNDNGTKRLLSNVMKTLEGMGVDINEFKDDIKDICTKIVLAIQPYLVNSFHTEMGVGDEGNQNIFHVFGLDILLDENHKCWVMEINGFPSFGYFFERTAIDPVDGSETQVRVVSDIDKYLKSLVLEDAIKIAWHHKKHEDSVFEKIFPPQESPENYKEFTIYNDARVLFELLAGYRKPDYLTLSQFQKLWHFPGMRNDTLTKPQYAIVFKNYAKRGNKSLMTLDNFNQALEYLGKELLPSSYNRHQLFSTIVSRLLNYIASS